MPALLRILTSSHYLLLSILLFAGLEIVFRGRYHPLLSLFIFLVALILGIVFIRLEERKLHTTHIILPLAAVVGAVSFTFFLLPTGWVHAYFLACAVLFFAILRYGARRAYPTWNWTLSMAVYFLLLAAAVAWRFYFYIPLILLLGIVFIVTWLMNWQILRTVVRFGNDAVLLATVLAFVMTQITWVFQFLPLHYLSQASMLVTFYYVAFHLIRVAQLRGLRRQDILEYTIVGIGIFIFIALTSTWL
jgi:hypothetical protein